MAHVREQTRNDGTPAYEVRWRQNGKHKQRTFSVKRQAERFAIKIENEMEAGQSTDIYSRRGKNVCDVVESVMVVAAAKLKPRTVLSYRQAYDNHILPTFGSRRISAVRSEEVEEWVGKLRASNLSAATVRNNFVALSKVFKYAIRHRIISTNPCVGTELPKATGDEVFSPHFLTPDQVEALACELDDRDPYGLIVRFTAYTGLRAGELAGLRVRDVNLLRREIRVERTLQRIEGRWVFDTPKSARSTRTVPLLRAELVQDLTAYLEEHPLRAYPDVQLWPGRAPGSHRLDWERPFHVGSFYRWHFRHALVRTGLLGRLAVLDDEAYKVCWADAEGAAREAEFTTEREAVDHLAVHATGGARFHDLRHSFASIMAAAGVDIYKVSRWMGHSNINTTDSVYTHLFNVDHSADMARVDTFVSQAKKTGEAR